MSAMNIQNKTVTSRANWDAVINSVQQQNQQVQKSNDHAQTPAASHDSPQGIPSRRPPNSADGPSLQQGIDNMTKTEVLFAIEALISMLFQLAVSQRKVRRESRMDDANAALEMGKESADDLRDEATMAVAGAASSATLQVAGSATVIAGGVRTVKNADTMAVSNKMMSYQAASQSFGAAGSVTQGGFNYQSKQDEAEKALHDASATSLKSREDIESDDEKEEAQVLQSIIQLREKEEDSRHEAIKSTV